MRSLPPILCALFLVLALAGCHRKPTLPPPDQTYTARGVLEQLPSQAHGDLMIHHETIPNFVDKDGNKTKMESMVMPFTPADDLSLKGISPGDKVEFTFEVRWNASPLLRVAKIRKLPADTELSVSPEG